MAKILTFGSMNLDYVYGVDHFVRAGETLAASSRDTYCGGKGLNQSIAIARAGGDAYHAGVIGTDGMALLDALNKDGVNTGAVRICGTPTGHTVIQCDPGGQNCILYYGGANLCIETADIETVIPMFAPGDYILLQNEINMLGDIIAAAKAAGMTVVFNPSPVDEGISNLPLDQVDIFILNEVEAAEISGVSDTNQALAVLRSKFANGDFLLTLGDKGAVYQPRGSADVLRQAAYKTTVVDTTAAGDTFTGYFVAGLAAGKPAKDAMELASKAAAIAVSRPGASPSVPYLAEVMESGLK